MIGKVHFGEARVSLKVRGPYGKKAEIEAVVDTGFSGWLTLPKSMIDWLGLQRVGPGRAHLGDGSVAVFDVYELAVQWNRRVLRVIADESPTTPLIGMSLLKGFELRVEVRPGGKVSIKPLPLSRRS